MTTLISSSHRVPGRHPAVLAAALGLPLLLVAACATAPPPSGALSSYADMTKSKARRTQAAVRVDGPALQAARSLRLEPVTFAGAVGLDATADQRALIANAIARKLCKNLSEHFDVVGPHDPADLSVKATVTRVKMTGLGLAAASIVVGHLSPYPLTPRIPLGLGGISAEGEALGPLGQQDAALTWSRDADPYSGGAVSTIGDAYEFSGDFADDFSKLLITGKDPVRDLKLPAMPKFHQPKHAADNCLAYGKGPGIAARVAGHFGAPPEWTDRQRSSPSGETPKSGPAPAP